MLSRAGLVESPGKVFINIRIYYLKEVNILAIKNAVAVIIGGTGRIGKNLAERARKSHYSGYNERHTAQSQRRIAGDE